MGGYVIEKITLSDRTEGNEGTIYYRTSMSSKRFNELISVGKPILFSEVTIISDNIRLYAKHLFGSVRHFADIFNIKTDFFTLQVESGGNIVAIESGVFL